MSQERMFQRRLEKLHKGLSKRAWDGETPTEILCSRKTFNELNGMFLLEMSVALPSSILTGRSTRPSSPRFTPSEQGPIETLGTWKQVAVREAGLPSSTLDLRTEHGCRHVLLDLLEVHEGPASRCELSPCPVRAVMEA